MNLDEFFLGYEPSRALFDAVRAALDSIGPTRIRISRSQIAFWRRRAVARIWLPGRYLSGRPAPLVLTLGFKYRDNSPRWKEIVEPAPGRFTHHLELHSVYEVDEEVIQWLQQAWENAA